MKTLTPQIVVHRWPMSQNIAVQATAEAFVENQLRPFITKRLRLSLAKNRKKLDFLLWELVGLAIGVRTSDAITEAVGWVKDTVGVLINGRISWADARPILFRDVHILVNRLSHQ